MATTTANVQGLVQAALAANTWFASNGITVIVESGTATPALFEDAMAAPGCCVIIGKPSYYRGNGNGLSINIPVECYENVTTNQGDDGTGIGIDTISETVWATCEKYTNGSYPQFSQLLPQTLDHDMVDLGTLVATITISTFSGISTTNI